MEAYPFSIPLSTNGLRLAKPGNETTEEGSTLKPTITDPLEHVHP